MTTKHKFGKPQPITLSPRAAWLYDFDNMVKVMVIGGSVDVSFKTPEKAVWAFGKIRSYLEHHKVPATFEAAEKAVESALN